MGIFKDKVSRLLRDDWKDVKSLAEELYVMFNSDGPILIDSQVQIDNLTPDQPAIVTNNFGNSQVVLQLNFRQNDGNPNYPYTLTPDDMVPDKHDKSADIRQVVVREIKSDSLVVDDPNDPTFVSIPAARPPALRGSVLSSASLGVDSYVYTGDDFQSRVATFDDPSKDDEQQDVTDPYFVGGTIYIGLVSNGVLDENSQELSAQENVVYIDLNVDARRWKAPDPIEESPPPEE